MRTWLSIALGSLIAVMTPMPANGQENATVNGTVVDESKAVLPGVTVTVTELETGRQYIGVTDARGEYRIPNVGAGTYKVQTDMPGFAISVVAKVELLVGQNATIPFSLKLANVQETVTVTSEAALVDLSSSAIAGNVDRRQMEELPLQGRNWMELSMMVKGITANNVDSQPGVSNDSRFQLNLDGQQITQKVAASSFGQPKFSREAIAEFQIITNLFDITQGRSSGIQVQAVSRSGTNKVAGSFYGSFRDSKYQAADPVAGVVLPFENQQLGAALGGPLVKDKMHYFVSYEYERQPQTIFSQPPVLPGESFALPALVRNNSFLTRYDQVLSSKDHLSVRASMWNFDSPFEASSTDHPSQGVARTRAATNVIATWSRVISANKVSELKVGFDHFDWSNLLAVPEMANTPNYVFSGLIIGGPRNFPQWFRQNQLTARYDLNWHKETHDLKIGGEYLQWRDTGEWHLLSRGEFTFSSNPDNLVQRFPANAYNNPAAWDLAGLDSRVIRFDSNYGDWTIDIPRPSWAVWFGDTWRLRKRLSINYGVRWDVDWGALAPPGGESQHVTWNPAPGWVEPQGIALKSGQELFTQNLRDLHNVAPRIGFNWGVNDKSDFVIRGGSGIYTGTIVSNITFGQQSFNGQRILVNSFPNDGHPGFLLDPTRGVSNDDIVTGKVPLPAQSPRVIASDYRMPFAWQSSIGFQKQLGPITGIDVDLTHWIEYHGGNTRDPNLFYNPATGYNNGVAIRPDPKFTSISWMESKAKERNMAIASSLTRRLKNNFQASMTYTFMVYSDADTDNNNPFFTFGQPWVRTVDFQRHTFRLNAIYRLPWRSSIAALYFFGSGNPVVTNIGGATPFQKTGTNRLNIGAPITIPARLADRWDGPLTIGTNELLPKNALMGLPLNKVDVRFSKDVNLIGSTKISLTAELFNLFNHANYGTYVGDVTLASFGAPRQNLGNAYTPRAAQFGFRLGF
jgi:hypothetical protein